MIGNPTDIGEEDAQEAGNATRHRLAQETESADIKFVMGSEEGRRFVWRLLERTGIYRSSFNTDAMAMAFAEGRRNEGLALLAKVQSTSPKLYTKLIEEQADDRNK